MNNRATFAFVMGADEEADELRIRHILLAREGATSPSPELIASVSPELVARERERMVAEIEADKRAAYLRSPEGRMEAQVKRNEEREARENRGQLARDFLVDEGALTREEAAELSTDEALRSARFEAVPFEDMTVEEQDQHYREHPEEAAAEEARLEREQLLDRWLSMDSMERAHAAAYAGADSVAEVEAELQRRGRDIGQPIAGVPAVEQAFQQAKEAE